MKLNMELIYVPVANIHQKREMMTEWKATSNSASKAALFCAVVPAAVFLIFKSVPSEFGWLHLVSALLFAAASYLCKKWSYWGYIAVLSATIINCSVVSLNYSEKLSPYFLSCVVIAVMSFVPWFFCFKCLVNYKNVFKELKKSKGFPNFIANTADLYGNKMYLRDKEKIQYEKNQGASYNGLNTEEDIKAEEFMRSQNLKVKSEGEFKVDNFESKEYFTQKLKQEPKTYKYGKKIFGKEIIFLHNDFDTMEDSEKRELMAKWHSNVRWATEGNLYIVITFMFMGAMIGGFQDFFVTMFFDFLVVLFIIGTNYVKMSAACGPYITLGVLAVYVANVWQSLWGAAFTLGALLVGIPTILGSIRCILNRHIYRALSKHEGFPHFIRTTAQLYGDQMYILEKKEPVKRRPITKEGMIVMDIGYDEKPKKDDGPWNAFDYRDKLREEEKGNENNS